MLKDDEYEYSDYQRQFGGIEPGRLSDLIKEEGMKTLNVTRYCARRYSLAAWTANTLLKTTNTFNLLIVEYSDKKLTVIFNKKIGVLLGMGGIITQTITNDAMARGIQAMKKFKGICNDYDVKPLAIGTSAIRDAKNNKQFIDSVYKETGIKIDVISGKKEAEYIYNGVKKTFAQKNGIIMDIGGGSIEIIYFKNNKIIKQGSFDTGISRIYQLFSFKDPMTKNLFEKKSLF